MSPLARGATSLGWLAAGALATLVAMLLATTAVGPRTVVLESRPSLTLPQIPSPGTIAPLDPRLANDLAEFVFSRAPVRPGRGEVTSPEQNPPTNEDDQPTLREQLTSPPSMTIRMEVDRSEARAGDVITYTMIVTNNGRGIARNVRITSHIPERTSYVPDECQEPVFVHENPASPAGYTIGTCDAAGFLAFQGAGSHPVTISYDSFGPGKQDRIVFRVAVNADAPAGTRIRNHSHVQATASARATSNVVTTIVTGP